MPQVSDYTALLSGASWTGSPSAARPVFLTYSFDEAAAPYVGEVFSFEFEDSFAPLSAAEKEAARQALQQWANASGIVFLEVAPGQGDIRFGTYDFDVDFYTEGAAGVAAPPSTVIGPDMMSRDEGLGGDVFLDESFASNPWVLLHEIGHALGLKHTFAGPVTLAGNLDNTANAVMSYNGDIVETDTLGRLDKDAIRALYGQQDSDGPHLSDWSWNGARQTLTQIGTSNGDTILGVHTKDKISGGRGDDLIGGLYGNDVLRGGQGQDTIFGGDGKDMLGGGGGRDRLNGGFGADRFEIVSLGEGADTVVDFSGIDLNPFSTWERDRLRLDSKVFGEIGRREDGLGMLDGVHFQNSTVSKAATPDIRMVYNRLTGILYFDADGSGLAFDKVALLNLNDTPNLLAKDIELF